MTLNPWLIPLAVALTSGISRADPPKTIQGAAAKELFEALAAAHVPFVGATVAKDKSGLVDAKGKLIDRTKVALVIEAAHLSCDYSSSTPYPDELVSDVDCTLDKGSLANPLALVKQLQSAGATFDAHSGGRTLKVTKVRCTRAPVPSDTTATPKHYSCEVAI